MLVQLPLLHEVLLLALPAHEHHRPPKRGDDDADHAESADIRRPELSWRELHDDPVERTKRRHGEKHARVRVHEGEEEGNTLPEVETDLLYLPAGLLL